MKASFEYPWICYTNKDKDVFENITMFDLSFDSKIHYFKNHETDYEQFLFKVLGFGVRITWNDPFKDRHET